MCVCLNVCVRVSRRGRGERGGGSLREGEWRRKSEGGIGMCSTFRKSPRCCPPLMLLLLLHRQRTVTHNRRQKRQSDFFLNGLHKTRPHTTVLASGYPDKSSRSPLYKGGIRPYLKKQSLD